MWGWGGERRFEIALASAAFILANTLGGGFAPLIATWLNSHWDSPLVLGFYTSGLSLLCLLALPETRDHEFVM